MTARTTAAAVANAFLDLQERDSGNFPRIDQMKIQKLVFYAHAWHLALRDTPLFDDDIEAWPWGPVARDVYLAFKDNGRKPIAGQRATTLTSTGSGFRIAEPPPPTQEEMKVIRAVWESHKPLTGVQLSNATHADGEPWSIVSQGFGGNLSAKPRIPNDLIADVFKAKAKR